MRCRRREWQHAGQVTVGVMKAYVNGVLAYALPQTYNFAQTRGVYAGGDVCLDETHPGPPYRTGGGLFVHHWDDPVTSVVSSGTFEGSQGSTRYVYEGGHICPTKFQGTGVPYSCANLRSETTNPGTLNPSACNAGSYGATGWNKFRPGKPQADLGVFIGEFRDVPRMLKDSANFFQNAWKAAGGTLKKPSKALANHWLSTQFGWLPFINDLRKFKRTSDNLGRSLEQIKRNNGRWVKRGGSIVEDSTTTVVSKSDTVPIHWPIGSNYLYSSPAGSHSIESTQTTRVWFEASFRYYIPPMRMERPVWRAKALAELYGAMPNPALIWELTPFSWLADWVSNAGDVISNLDNGWAENLAARGAWVMKSHETVGSVRGSLNYKSGGISDVWNFPVSWKSRAAGSRFGFGLTDADFSARQWSILAALGIQRYR